MDGLSDILDGQNSEYHDIGFGSMVDELSGMGKADPNEIANAVSKSVKDIANAFRSNNDGGGDIPIGKVLLIFGIGYLALKVLDKGFRD